MDAVLPTAGTTRSSGEFTTASDRLSSGLRRLLMIVVAEWTMCRDRRALEAMSDEQLHDIDLPRADIARAVRRGCD